MTEAQTKIMSREALAMLGAPRIVYIREVDANSLRAEGALPPGFALPEGMKLYALHAANGDRMAIMDNRDAAILAAKRRKMEPVSVH